MANSNLILSLVAVVLLMMVIALAIAYARKAKQFYVFAAETRAFEAGIKDALSEQNRRIGQTNEKIEKKIEQRLLELEIRLDTRLRDIQRLVERNL